VHAGVVGEDGCSQAVRSVIGSGNGLFLAREGGDDNDGSEELLAIDFVLSLTSVKTAGVAKDSLPSFFLGF